MNDSEQPEPDVALDYDSISVLIPRSRDGDAAAQQELLVQMQEYLNLMANQHMDPALQRKVGPSDVVQQTLTQVIQHFDEFRGGTAAEFRGWLKAIVVNEMHRIRRTYRTGKRNIGREQPLDPPVSGVTNPYAPADGHPTPSSEAITAEQIANFHQILEQLPDDYADVIRLRSIERLSFREIAESMDRSHDSVTKLWYRAVLKFEELLKASGGFTSQG